MANRRKRKRRKSYYQRKPFSLFWLAPILFIIGIVPLIVFGKVYVNLPSFEENQTDLNTQLVEIQKNITELEDYLETRELSETELNVLNEAKIEAKELSDLINYRLYLLGNNNSYYTDLESEYFTSQDINADYFSFYKAIYFIIAGYIGFLFVFILYWLKKIEIYDDKKVYILLGIYVVFTILSAINAEDTVVALRGFIEVFQGVFVYIAYAIVVFTVYNLVRYDSHIKAVIYVFIGLGTVVGILGVGQYLGYDFFRLQFVQQMILPDLMRGWSLGFNFGEHTIYATMYNTNYVGSFAAMMVPLSLVLFFYARKPRDIALSSLFVVLMVFLTFGSNSRAGMIGLSSGLVLYVVFFRKVLMKNYIKTGVSLALVLVIITSLSMISPRLMSSIRGLNLFNEFDRIETNRVYFEDMTLDGHSLEIITDDLNFYVTYDIENQDFSFYKSKGGEPLVFTEDKNRFIFSEQGYDQFVITVNSSIWFRVRMYQENIDVVISPDQFFIAGYRGEMLDEITQPPRVHLFDGYERMFSGRVFIWSRSIPLLWENIFVGSGPGHYISEYPQNEYVGRMNGIRIAIVDKAHNMYLQIGIETGLVSLLALIGVFGIYLFNSSKLFLNRQFRSFNDYIGFGVFISVFSYLVTGLFNDQRIEVAPLFYVMLGLGFALNRKLTRDDAIKEQVKD